MWGPSATLNAISVFRNELYVLPQTLRDHASGSGNLSDLNEAVLKYVEAEQREARPLIIVVDNIFEPHSTSAPHELLQHDELDCTTVSGCAK